MGSIKTFVSIAVIVAAIVAALTLVKTATITRAPSGVDAMVAIRLAERQMLEKKKAQPSGEAPSVIDAEETLKLAWAAFRDRRYNEAIAAAKRAEEAARKVG